MVESFLAEHDEFRLDPRPEALPAQTAPLVDARGFLRTLSHRHGLEVFFGAALVRR